TAVNCNPNCNLSPRCSTFSFVVACRASREGVGGYCFRRGHSGCVWTPGKASCPQVAQNVSLLGENQKSAPLSVLTCFHILPSCSSCLIAWYTGACRVSSRLAITSCTCHLRTGRYCRSMYN